MAQANSDPITSRRVKLSQLFVNPFVRDAFRRAEDNGDCNITVTFAGPPDRPRLLQGGAAERVRELEFA
jgi:hypothetical protein